MAIQSLSQFCASLGLPPELAPEIINALADRELLALTRHQARMARCAGRPDAEALPLRDETGQDFGVVEARIPRALFGNLLARPNFGWDGLTSDEGLRDLLRDNPQCRVQTVSGRIRSGWTPGRRVMKKYG